ncbi:DUF4836 domain-containing protein [Brachyspira pulli]|uniref:DUF4836 domain-containing protein n=1 Tax=Brachyspira pulli TaxID=310721 RepID=UPI003006C2D0
MKRVVLVALLFLLTLSTFTYAVDKKYIPNNVDSVVSLNAELLSQKAEIDLQQILNQLFMQKYADNFLEYRDDPFVAEVMTNKLNEYIDFSKPAKVVSFNGYQQMSVILDVKNITELDRVMIKIASQEDKLVAFSENAEYRYIMLDEYNLISWNDEVFTVTLKLKGSYWYDEELNKEDITSIANYIFVNNTPLEDEKFLSLENETNDSYAWVNLSILADENASFSKFLLGRSYDSIPKESYKDSIITTKINFTNGEAEMIFDSYAPNYPYDITLLKKQLVDNIYGFVNGENNYGFLSLSLNTKELATHMKNVFSNMRGFSLAEDFKTLEKYGVDVYKFIEIFGGDIFFSVWDNGEGDENMPALLFSASIADVDMAKIILKALSDSINNDIYIVDGYVCYIKDSILYASDSEDVINSIINGEAPATKLDENKLNLAKNNTMSIYLEFSPNLSLYGVGDEYTEAFESMYFTSNILEANHTQMILKVTTRDKERNSLAVMKSFFGLE